MSPQPPHTQQSSLALGSLLQYASVTRYVVRASRRNVLSGASPEFIDIKSSDVLPPGSFIPPPPIQFLYDANDRTFAQAIVQNHMVSALTRETPPSQHWWYDFAYWQLRGGTDPKPQGGRSTNTVAPTALMLPEGVETLAIYNLDGGPDIDTTAWTLEALDLDGAVTVPVPRVFHVLTQPSASRDDRANLDGLVDTQDVPDQQVQALSPVSTGSGLGAVHYAFSHWTVGNSLDNPLNDAVLTLPTNTSGRAIAWYNKYDAPFPIQPNTWHDVLGGWADGRVMREWSPLLKHVMNGLTLSTMAEEYAPAIRSVLHEAAIKQVTWANDALVKELRSRIEASVVAGKAETTKRTRLA